MTYKLTPMTAEHIPQIAALEQVCFSHPWVNSVSVSWNWGDTSTESIYSRYFFIVAHFRGLPSACFVDSLWPGSDGSAPSPAAGPKYGRSRRWYSLRNSADGPPPADWRVGSGRPPAALRSPCRTPKGKVCCMSVRECVETGSAFLHIAADELDEMLEQALGTAKEETKCSLL